MDPLRNAGPLGPAGAPQAPAPGPAPKAAPQGGGFRELLDTKLAQPSTSGLSFSGHALQRMQRRGITLDGGRLDRLQGGVDRAAAKGSRDSLVLVDDDAFVVSVRNRTVITAVDREHMREQVFTNIDSAVIA